MASSESKRRRRDVSLLMAYGFHRPFPRFLCVFFFSILILSSASLLFLNTFYWESLFVSLLFLLQDEQGLLSSSCVNTKDADRVTATTTSLLNFAQQRTIRKRRTLPKISLLSIHDDVIQLCFSSFFFITEFDVDVVVASILGWILTVVARMLLSSCSSN